MLAEVWPITENSLYLSILIIICLISGAVAWELFKRSVGRFYRIISIVGVLLQLLGISHGVFNLLGLKDRMTGRWMVENVYRITRKLPGGKTEKLDPVRGIGEQYVLCDPVTGSFEGLGWMNIGTSYDDLSKALMDTAGNDFVTFRIEGGHTIPDGGGKIKFATLSVHKTLRQHLNTIQRSRCEVEFLEPLSERNWAGSAFCETDSFEVKIEVRLSKTE